MTEREPRVLAIDAGGTKTDTFVVDGHGSFVVGKAQTTPEGESRGFMASAEDALARWDMSPEDTFPRVDSTRAVRWRDGEAETSIVRLEEVEAGHEVTGPAIVEHSATTFAIPPGRAARLDRHQIFHLSASG